MSIKKTFYPEKGTCRVFFTLPESLAIRVKKAAIVGDFNDWNPEKTPMKKLNDGKFGFTLELPLGKDYEFRYFLDNYRWENDREADALAPTPYMEVYNSVIKCKLA